MDLPDCRDSQEAGQQSHSSKTLAHGDWLLEELLQAAAGQALGGLWAVAAVPWFSCGLLSYQTARKLP